MPKAITPQRIVSALKRKGFILKRVKGSHHIFQHPVSRRRVIVPVHKKDLPKGTLHTILDQTGLSLDDL